MTTAVKEDLGFVHKYVPAKSGTDLALLLLHGTGGDENDLLGLGQLIAPGAALVSPRGRVSENGMLRFFKRFAEGVFDQVDLEARTAELGEFVRRARAEYGLRQMVAVGFSNGANIATSLLFRDGSLLDGAVLIRGMVPFVSQKTSDSLREKPVLLLNSSTDPIVPSANAEQLATLFRLQGAAVTLNWEQGGHALTQEDVVVARDWLRRHFANH